MKQSYLIAKKSDTQEITEYLVRHGEHLLSMVDLMEASEIAVGEMIDRLGRANLEAVLYLSAQKVAGEKHQGRRGGEVTWHGSQPGSVCLGAHKVQVNKPRLRRKGRGKGAEIEIPVYEAMNGGEGVGHRMLEILMPGGFHPKLRACSSRDGFHGGRQQVHGEQGAHRGQRGGVAAILRTRP